MSRPPKKTPEGIPPTPNTTRIESISRPTLEAPRGYIPPIPAPWPVDEDDRWLTPFESFINDFVFHMKGKESPVLFNIFAALWGISTMSIRKAYFRWAMDALWPNIYVLVVADPSVCHKGAAMGRMEKLLKRLSQALASDPIMASEKRFNFMNSNTSPEFLYDMLEPRIEHFIMPPSDDFPEGRIHKELFGSTLAIWASELTTMISNKKYTSGMIENLTSWFDCADEDESGTKTSGKRRLKNIYITLAGALTPQHFSKELPPEAYSTGFMSRCIVVYQQKPTVYWPEPVDFPCAPSREDLVARLSWLAYTARGEYDFTPEAREYYRTWYIDHQARQLNKDSQIARYARARFTQTVIRIATLLRMSEYRPGHDVGLPHLTHAIRLLEHVFTLQEPIVAEVDQAPEAVPYIKVRDMIRKDQQIQRSVLLRRMSARGILVLQVNAALAQLRAENRIEYIFNGRLREGMEPLNNTKEIYRWSASPIEDLATMLE
jgi:hypothetical protein